MKLIAETAWHHEGNFDFLINLINELNSKCSPDYIKLHITLDFDEYMDKSHPGYSLLKNMLLTSEQWKEVILQVLNNSKPLLLFNDIKAVDFGMKFEPEVVEIHSVCLNDINLLDSLRSNINSNTTLMLGVGGSNLYEIEKAIERLKTQNIILMHGFQNYPTKYEDINLNKIRKIVNLYPNFKHGYADHTSWNHQDNLLITLMGASVGMDFVEKHVTTLYGQERVDYSAAISIDMFNELKEKIVLLSQCNGSGFLELNEGEKKYSKFGQMKKAAVLNKDVVKGEECFNNSFRFVRTGEISDLSQLDVIEKIGMRFSRDIPRNSILNSNDFMENGQK